MFKRLNLFHASQTTVIQSEENNVRESLKEGNVGEQGPTNSSYSSKT